MVYIYFIKIFIIRAFYINIDERVIDILIFFLLLLDELKIIK